jgi:3-oxoacyl-[acyl-carrier-protein] synthase II
MSEATRNGRRRVVVTGIGMVTPIGNDPESTWDNLVAGEVGGGPITHFDASEYPVRFACELKDFDPTVWIERKQARRMDRFSQMALSAARMAEADSGLAVADDPDRVGAAVATGIGGLGAFENCFELLLERGPDRVGPFAIVQIIPNMAAAWVSMELGTRGPLAAESTACAASNMALGDGLDAIRLGRADAMFCGGTEAPVTRVGVAGFSAMRALSQRNDDPQRGSRPFEASSWARPERCSCSRSSSTRGSAGRRSMPRCSAMASPLTQRTSPSPTRPGRTRLAR